MESGRFNQGTDLQYLFWVYLSERQNIKRDCVQWICKHDDGWSLSKLYVLKNLFHNRAILFHFEISTLTLWQATLAL